MFKTIEGAADCEIRSVIRFLKARNVLPSEIHHQNCQVYGDNAMSDGKVRKWVRMCNEGRKNVYVVARSGLPSLLNDNLMRKVNERVRVTDVSQFLICPCTFLRFQGLYAMTLSQSFGSQGAAFYEEGIQKLVPRYGKCLNNGGEYVGK